MYRPPLDVDAIAHDEQMPDSDCSSCENFQADSVLHVAQHYADVHDDPTLLNQMTDERR